MASGGSTGESMPAAAELAKQMGIAVALGLGAAVRNPLSLPWWDGAGPHRPLVIAHRGSSLAATENTMRSFRLARAHGADALELDVRRCRSGEVVVMHDLDLERMTGARRKVSECGWDELCQLEVRGGDRIPSLQEVLTDPDCPPRVNIEIKAEDRETDGIEASLVDVIRRVRAQDRVVVSSFNPFSLGRLAKLEPAIPRALLFARDTRYRFLRRPWLAPLARPHLLNPHHPLVTPLFMRWAKLLGYRVLPWTVDEPAEWDRLIDLGVDGIITNCPDRLRAHLGLA